MYVCMCIYIYTHIYIRLAKKFIWFPLAQSWADALSSFRGGRFCMEESLTWVPRDPPLFHSRWVNRRGSWGGDRDKYSKALRNC